MKRHYSGVLGLMAGLTLALTLGFSAQAAAPFTLTSPQVADGGKLTTKQVFNGFGCTGENVSPALAWSNAPAGTKSFAVTVYDPDAPTGSGWWHWVVYNIPADVASLQEGAGSNPSLLPKGAVQSVTDFGAPGFGGACPPPGDKPHRYVFTVHALGTPAMDLPPATMPAAVGFNIHGNVLGRASFTATYGR